MSNSLSIKKEIKQFNKVITVSGDKSISIRRVLLSSLASGVSRAQNLLISGDVLAAINAVRKLGIKVILKDKFNRIVYDKKNKIRRKLFSKNLNIGLGIPPPAQIATYSAQKNKNACKKKER